MKKVKCKNCFRERPVFCLGENDCDKCRPEVARKKVMRVAITSGDVIAKARKLLGETDWTQMPDARPGKAAQYKPYREALRRIVDDMEDGKDPNKVKWPESTPNS